MVTERRIELILTAEGFDKLKNWMVGCAVTDTIQGDPGRQAIARILLAIEDGEKTVSLHPKQELAGTR